MLRLFLFLTLGLGGVPTKSFGQFGGGGSTLSNYFRVRVEKTPAGNTNVYDFYQDDGTKVGTVVDDPRTNDQPPGVSETEADDPNNADNCDKREGDKLSDAADNSIPVDITIDSNGNDIKLVILNTKTSKREAKRQNERRVREAGNE